MAFAAALAEKRGPRVGDAASLWNFTPAPGWTREEVQILRLCIMKHGVGQWLQIIKTGLLPGKMIQQLNGQTQRLLGQQSLAAYTGLQVDVDRVRADNEARTDATRKAGLVINDGPNMTKEMKEKLRKEAQAKYGLTAEQLQKVDEQLEEVACAFRSTHAGADEAAAAAGATSTAARGNAAVASLAAAATQAAARQDPELGELLCEPLEQLTQEQIVQLLKRLRNRLACLIDRYRSRQSLPARFGPHWAGEQEAAALLAAQCTAVAAAARTRPMGHGPGSPETSAGADAGLAAVGADGLILHPAARQLLGDATACRGRPPLPAGAAAAAQAGASGAAAAASRKRGGGGGGAKAGRSRSQGSGEWSVDEENAAPSRGGGSKRKASEEPGGAAGGSRRGARAKRPATRYDKYVDDAEYDEEAADPAVYGSSSSRSGSGLVEPTEAINALTAMGFTPRKARGALRECDFNVEAAVEWLFANCV